MCRVSLVGKDFEPIALKARLCNLEPKDSHMLQALVFWPRAERVLVPLRYQVRKSSLLNDFWIVFETPFGEPHLLVSFPSRLVVVETGAFLERAVVAAESAHVVVCDGE